MTSYSICCKYLVRPSEANSVDLDQTAPMEQSDQGLPYLPIVLINSLVSQIG